MSTTQQVTGTIITRGNLVLITLRKQREHYQRHEKQSLTAKDHHILKLMARGLTNKAIAYKLDLHDGTVKDRCTTIFQKLKVTNRVQAVLKWQAMTGYKFEFEYAGNHHQVLSKRETQVAELIAEGDSSKVIAHKLGLSEETIWKITRQVFGKLVVRNRLEVALVYRAFYKDK